MGHIDVSAVEYTLSDGRLLLNDVNFRVGDGAKSVDGGGAFWRGVELKGFFYFISREVAFDGDLGNAGL